MRTASATYNRATVPPEPARTRMPLDPSARPRTLAELRNSGWRSRSVKQEVHDNFLRKLAAGEELFPGIIGYDETVIPELNIALLAQHDLLFLGEKGQAKSRLMRRLVDFLDDEVPYLDDRKIPLHDDPFRPITKRGKQLVGSTPADEVPIAWWRRDDRYAERLAPGTKFADLIGEIDPAMLAAGVSMGAEEALHFGLIPRMHRGLFAMNELPELDELVQVGLFNILEERDVQIRGYPVKFDIDVMVLFSANPATYNRSGKVIPQLKDRIGSIIHTHYPLERSLGVEILEQEVDSIADLGMRNAEDGEHFTPQSEFRNPPSILVPYFMKELVEEISRAARRSKYVDHDSGVSARLSLANYRTLIASARHRAAVLGEAAAVPRISDLGHLYASSLGKLELDLMGSHQMTERQVLDAVVAEAIATVFGEYVDEHGLAAIAEVFAQGVRVEVGDMLPSSHYAALLQRVPPAWDKAFEVNASADPAVRASCVEFVLAGLYATDRISRSQQHGRIVYEV